MNQHFFQQIAHLTDQVNGQYPRPWMTDLSDPTHARIFIVGCSPATPYRVDQLSHERHLNALFNMNGENCRTLYREIRNSPSGYRENIDDLTGSLKSQGFHDILETNAVCYSVPESAELSRLKNQSGVDRGILLFSTVFQTIKPRIMIVSGGKNSTIKYLSKGFKKNTISVDLTACCENKNHYPCCIRASIDFEGTLQPVLFIFIRSLGKPEWNKWQRWASEHFQQIAELVSQELKIP